MSATQHVFTYGSNTIEVVDRYKYLGLILTDMLDYNVTVFMVAKTDSHSLGLLKAKSNVDCLMKYIVTYAIHLCIL